MIRVYIWRKIGLSFSVLTCVISRFLSFYFCFFIAILNRALMCMYIIYTDRCKMNRNHV